MYYTELQFYYHKN